MFSILICSYHFMFISFYIQVFFSREMYKCFIYIFQTIVLIFVAMFIFKDTLHSE